MKKVHWIQFKVCDEFSQLYLRTISTMKNLSRKHAFHSGIIKKKVSIIYHISGEEMIQQSSDPYLCFINWNKNLIVME